MCWLPLGKYFHFYLQISLFILFNAPVHGQHDIEDSSGFSIKMYNDETSNLQNTITGMAFDKNHYLWIGTQYGIFRFDGRHFSSINTFTNHDLKYNRILSVATDAANNIFITDEQWNLYKAIDSRTILPVKDLDGDGFLLHIPGSPAFHFKPRLVFENSSQLRDYLHLPNTGIEHIYSLDSANAYISYLDDTRTEKLVLLKDGNIVPATFPGSKTLRTGFVINHRLFFLQPDGSFYTKEINGDWKSGKIMISLKRKKQPVLYKSGSNFSMASVYANATGNFLVNNHSLFSIKLAGDSLIAYEIFSGLSLENVNGVLYNADENTYFISTLTTGLALIREKDFTCRRATGLARPELNNFYAQAEIKPNTVLTHNYIVFSGDKTTSIPQSEISRLAMLKDSQNNLWYLRNDTIFKSGIDLTGEKYIGKTPGPVNSFLEKKNLIWFTTQYNLGYIENDSIFQVKSSIAFDSGFIQCMSLPDTGGILVGTQRGLYRINPKDASVAKLNTTLMYVRNISTSREGFTWIGTYGQGMFCLYQGRLIRLPVDKNGYLSTAHCFLEDSLGYIWISTNKGLFRVRKKDMINYALNKVPNIYIHYFDKTEGFGSNEFNGGCSPCGLQLANGDFSFPSLNGLVQFNPTKIIPVTPNAPLFLDNIVLDNQTVVAMDGASFKSDFHQLVFHFSTPYYGNANNLAIEYQLEGFNTDWNNLNSDGLVAYNNLPKGNYTLVLRKMSDFGKSGYDEKKVRFTILPNFYETPAFYFLSLLLLAALVYGVYKLRYQWIIRTNRKLEKEVKLHVAQHKRLIIELQDSIEELEVSRERLIKVNNDKEKLISILVHDLSSPLKFLNKLSTRLHTQFDNMGSAERRELIRALNGSSTEIFIFSDNFLKWLHPSKIKMKSVIQEFDAKVILDELYLDYINIAGFRNNTIEKHVNSAPNIISDRFAVKIIMRNAIVIANSYIENCRIRLSFTSQQEINTLLIQFPASPSVQESIEKIYLLHDDLEGLEIGEYPLFINFSIIKTLLNKINGAISIIHTTSDSLSLSVVFPNLTVPMASTSGEELNL